MGTAIRGMRRSRSRSISRAYDHAKSPTENRLPADRIAWYLENVAKVVTQHKHTIWTAPASQDVPALVQLDLRAPIASVKDARKRAAKARAKVVLGAYASRPSAESLRKRVK